MFGNVLFMLKSLCVGSSGRKCEQQCHVRLQTCRPGCLPSALNGCPGNAFSELEHQNVLCCTNYLQYDRKSLDLPYVIPGTFPQGQSLPLELTNNNT